jgi:hypothetical protein
MIFVAKKMVGQQNIPHNLFVLLLDPGSGMDKKSGSGINIPDPQHCEED